MHKKTKTKIKQQQKKQHIFAFYIKENIYLVMLVTINIKNIKSHSVIFRSEQVIQNHPVYSNILGYFLHPLCLLFLVSCHF